MLDRIDVPQTPEEEEALSGGACGFACSKCDGRMQQIAFITQPKVINAILERVGRKEVES